MTQGLKNIWDTYSEADKEFCLSAYPLAKKGSIPHLLALMETWNKYRPPTTDIFYMDCSKCKSQLLYYFNDIYDDYTQTNQQPKDGVLQ